MRHKKTIALCMILFLIVSLSAFMPQQERKAENLKVLPKDIGHKELDKVMDGFKAALGVKCSFCHAPRKDDPTKLDFASDEKPEKEVARGMMRMTAKINKKYFHQVGEDGKVVNISCITCHNGREHPQTL